MIMPITEDPGLHKPLDWLSPRPVLKLSIGADNSKSAGCNWFGAGSTPRPECKQIKSRIALSGDEACATALDSKRISHREFFQAVPETTSSAAVSVSGANATQAVLDSRRMSHRAEFRASEPNAEGAIYSA